MKTIDMVLGISALTAEIQWLQATLTDVGSKRSPFV